MSDELNNELEQMVQKAPISNNTNMKDLLIPISIIIAGVAVGAGLYFGGSPTDTAAPLQPSEATAQAAGNTDKVNPVTADDHIRGDVNAPIKLVEYSDFDCPFCSRFHDVMNDVIEKYDGEVAWVFRQFPLEQLHPQAPAVAVASECVAEIGGNDAFWKYADAYFGARGSGDKTAHSELIPRSVTSAGVSQQAFTECFESGRLTEAVQSDMDNAVETGGRGTPWSIIVGPSGKTYPVNGALPIQALEQIIDLAIKEA